MKRMIGLAVLLLFGMIVSVGCGGGGGDSPGVTRPGENLNGTYSLMSVTYSNGQTITDCSGTLKINTADNTIQQSTVINNVADNVSGTFTVTWIAPHERGYFHITDQYGTQDVFFTVPYNNLYMRYTYPNYEETYGWEKISDTL